MFAKQFGIDLIYTKRLAPEDGFNNSVETFFADTRCIGANVTMPFKHDALAWVDNLSSQAMRAGAVNTIIRKKNSFVGDNTDGIGLVTDLENHGVVLQDAYILLIGAGGAAKGALPALLDAGIKSVTIYNRSEDKARELQNYTNSYAGEKASLFRKTSTTQFDVIINATSLSLNGQVPDLPDDIFNNNPSVYDMVYQSQPTAFLNKAIKLGCTNTIDGLGMLVHQAAYSFYLWFAKKPNCDPVYQYLRDLNK